MTLKKLAVLSLALAPMIASIAHASTRSIVCSGDSLSLSVESDLEQIRSVKVLKSNDRVVSRNISSGGAKGLMGPSLSTDEALPQLYEGEFKSPSPQGQGGYTLSFSADGSKAELDYDNDDGDMRVYNLRCSQ